MYNEVPQARNSPIYPEEAWGGENMVPSPSEREEAEEWVPEDEKILDERHSAGRDRERDERRRTGALSRGNTVLRGIPPAHPEKPSGSSRSLGSHQGHNGCRSVLWEQERNSSSLAAGRPRQTGGGREKHVRIRFKP
ncbi:hypothetical protein ACLKA6_016232 [Drosophila palustris]